MREKKVEKENISLHIVLMNVTVNHSAMQIGQISKRRITINNELKNCTLTLIISSKQNPYLSSNEYEGVRAAL